MRRVAAVDFRALIQAPLRLSRLILASARCWASSTALVVVLSDSAVSRTSKPTTMRATKTLRSAADRSPKGRVSRLEAGSESISRLIASYRCARNASPARLRRRMSDRTDRQIPTAIRSASSGRSSARPRHQRHDALKEFCNRVPIPSGRIVGNNVDRTSTCPACHSDLPLLRLLVEFPTTAQVLKSLGAYRLGADPGLFPDDVDLGVGTRVSAVVDLVGALLGGLDGIGRERRRA